jgi:hypothetical protein
VRGQSRRYRKPGPQSHGDARWRLGFSVDMPVVTNHKPRHYDSVLIKFEPMSSPKIRTEAGPISHRRVKVPAPENNVSTHQAYWASSQDMRPCPNYWSIFIYPKKKPPKNLALLSRISPPMGTKYRSWWSTRELLVLQVFGSGGNRKAALSVLLVASAEQRDVG